MDKIIHFKFLNFLKIKLDLIKVLSPRIITIMTCRVIQFNHEFFILMEN
jgi:hypothetical protein